MRRTAGAWLIAVGVLAPLLPLLLWSVSSSWRYPDLFPVRLTGRGWRLLVDPHSEVLTGLATSLTIGLSVTVLAVAIGMPAGRALGLYEFRGKPVVRFLLLAPVLVPGLAVLLGTQVVFLRLGLADSAAGVVLVQLIPTVPYVTMVLASAFENFDVRYEQQARLLGAGPGRAFFQVTVPSLTPALAVAGYFAFVISWSDYVLTFLIGGGQVKTLPLLLFAYAQGTDLTQAAAVAVLLLTPPLVLLAVLARRLPDQPGPVIGLGRL